MRNHSLIALTLFLSWGPLAVAADPFEQAPIDYSRVRPDNRISALNAALDRGDERLTFDEKYGYLPSLLEKLAVSRDSQLLVFAKTSFQRKHISPDTPRAIYFNDDLYVGYCQNSDTIEVSTADPKLGAVYYTLEQTKADKPHLTRETRRCLQCHATTQTENVPSHLVRSLFVDAGGTPVADEDFTRVDSTTPIEQRWGGWYVTGTHGPQWHHGNQLIYDTTAPKPWNSELGFNITDLKNRFDTSNYLTPHSDIVALLVFEHQTYVHNLLTKATYAAQQVMYDQAQSAGGPSSEGAKRIDAAAEALVRGLLFADDSPVKGPFNGTSGFADEFAGRGPRDTKGRSLREFDLQTRLFIYPCSYLIYSRAFDELPEVMRQAVARKLRHALLGPRGKRYEHVIEEDRQAVAEILKDTKPEFWSLVVGE